MKFFLHIVIFFGIATITNAQQNGWKKQWDYRYGGNGGEGVFSFHRTSNGGYFLGGLVGSGISGDVSQPNWGSSQTADYWGVKLDSNGLLDWEKRFGTINHDGLHASALSTDGGIGLLGIPGGGISGDKTEAGYGGMDYWLVKVDEDGNKVWDRSYGGPGSEHAWALIATKDGGFLLGGFSNSGVGGLKSEPSRGGWDYWVIKVDSLGNKEWDKTLGGSDNDFIYGNSIEQSSDGGYIVGGYTNSGKNGDISEPKVSTLLGGHDGWIVKLDATGNIEWDRRYGSTDANYTLHAVKQALDVGYMLYANGNWLIKVDSSGDEMWQKDLSPSSGMRFLFTTQDKGFLLSGSTAANAVGDKSEANLGPEQTWVIKIDSTGTKQWDKTIFTTDSNFGSAIEINDSCFAVGAHTISEVGGYKSQAPWNSSTDFWIVKLCYGLLTGIDEADSEDGLLVYPNPFTTDLNISLQIPNTTAATFRLLDLHGKVIFERDEKDLAPNYTKMLDLSYLVDGIYFVEVIANGKQVVRKVIKNS